MCAETRRCRFCKHCFSARLCAHGGVSSPNGSSYSSGSQVGACATALLSALSSFFNDVNLSRSSRSWLAEHAFLACAPLSPVRRSSLITPTSPWSQKGSRRGSSGSRSRSRQSKRNAAKSSRWIEKKRLNQAAQTLQRKSKALVVIVHVAAKIRSSLHTCVPRAHVFSVHKCVLRARLSSGHVL